MADTTPSPSSKPNGKPSGSQASAADPEYRPKTARKRRKGRGKRKRRSFTPEYKLQLLAELDALEESGAGQTGAVLRREGLYSSLVSTWRRQRDEGLLQAMGRKRGRKADPNRDMKREMRKLHKENERLRTRLQKAETIIDVQKKLCDLLGLEPGGKSGRRG